MVENSLNLLFSKWNGRLSYVEFFNNAKNINKKETRDGTYDANLKRIGD